MSFDSIPALSETGRAAALFQAGQYRRATVPPLYVGLVALCTDFATTVLGMWFGLFTAVASEDFAPWPAAAVAAMTGLVATALLAGLGRYSLVALGRRPGALAWPAACAALAAGLCGPAMPLQHPSGIASVMAVCAGVVVTWRLLLSGAITWAREAGLTDRRAVLAGGGPAAAALMRELAGRKDNDIRIVGIFDDRDDARSPPQILGVPKLGRFADLPDFCRHAEIDLVIVTLPLSAEDRMAQVLRLFRVLPLPVYISDLARDRRFHGHGPALIPALPASFQPRRRLVKRAIDLLLGGAAMLVLWPVMAVAAIAIRLDSPGPILFRQSRHGFNDRMITVLKFRTMYHDRADPHAQRVVSRQDCRVTPVGRVLRRTSIDELPQLFNVLGGTMSLVGPRPHVLIAKGSNQQTFADMVECYSARHRLPPGMTGLAQINGWRGEVTEPEELRQRVAHDLYYIENWSLWMDLRILVQTPLSLVNGRGAY